MTDRRHYCLFTGGRKFAGREAVRDVLIFLKAFYGDGLRVMHGAAGGLDTLVAEACEELGIRCKAYPAKWKRGGVQNKMAGFERNSQMVDLLAGWAKQPGISAQVLSWPGGNGTRDCSRKAEEAGLMVDYIAPTDTVDGPAL